MLTMSLVVLAAVIGQAETDGPADAIHPRNRSAEQLRIEQLEREVAKLQERLARIEARQGVQQTVYLPPPTWMPAQPAPLVAPVPAPLPQNGQQEINGIRFRMFLLGGDDEKPASITGFQSGGITIVR